MIYFYDTSELLRELPILEDNDTLVICNIVWQELKQIKDDKRKSERTQRAAKKAIKWLTDNPFIMIKYKGELESEYEYINNDDRIIYCVGWYYFNEPFDDDFIFITHDKAMYLDAIEKDIPVSLTVDVDEPINEDYKGFKEFTFSDEEWINFQNKEDNYYEILSNMLINEYVIIHYFDKKGNNCEYCAKKVSFILEGEECFDFEEIPYPKFTSSKLDDMKPKDCYQRCAMDALNTTDFVILRGKPGSGKTLAALSYLMYALEHHEIEKIYMLVNPVATRDSARLGYLPGDKNAKILDSNIGSLLAAKFGDKIGVDYLIDSNKLELLPVSDIRGVSIPSNAACYVTESQNLTIDLMKLIIQRCEEGCKIIIEGDNDAQVDMLVYDGKNNGLRRAIEVFKGQEFFATVTLDKIHRSRMAEVANKM